MPFKIVRNDITRVKADVIVNTVSFSIKGLFKKIDILNRNRQGKRQYVW